MFRSYSKDKNLRKIWRTIFENGILIWGVPYITSRLLKEAAKYGHVKQQTADIAVDIATPILLIYFLILMCYWIMPKWFRKRQHVEQTAEECITTTAT